MGQGKLFAGVCEIWIAGVIATVVASLATVCLAVGRLQAAAATAVDAAAIAVPERRGPNAHFASAAARAGLQYSATHDVANPEGREDDQS